MTDTKGVAVPHFADDGSGRAIQCLVQPQCFWPRVRVDPDMTSVGLLGLGHLYDAHSSACEAAREPTSFGAFHE